MSNDRISHRPHVPTWLEREPLSCVVSKIAVDRIKDVSRFRQTLAPTSTSKIVDALIRACPDEILLQEVNRVLNDDESAVAAFQRKRTG